MIASISWKTKNRFRRKFTQFWSSFFMKTNIVCLNYSFKVKLVIENVLRILPWPICVCVQELQKVKVWLLIFYAGRIRNLLFLNNISKLFIWLIYMSLNLIGRSFDNNYELLVCAAEWYCKFNKCISVKNTTRYVYQLIYPPISPEHTSQLDPLIMHSRKA